MHKQARFLISALLLMLGVLSCLGSDASLSPTRAAQGAITDSPPHTPAPLDPTELPTIERGASVGYLAGGPTVSATGDFQYAIPLEVPAGRAGMQPSLSLAYSSRGANGIAGVGVSLSVGSSIRRCAKTIATEGAFDRVNFNAGDSLCLDGAKLVEVGAGEYRTEEESFVRVVAEGPQAAPTSFRVWLKDGRIRSYAPHFVWRASFNSVGVASYEQVVASWRLEHEEDRAGNALHYEYEDLADPTDPYTSESRLRRIRYTDKVDPATGTTIKLGQRQVELIYEPRPDPIVDYESGVRYATRSRLMSIEMHAPDLAPVKGGIQNRLVWAYHLAYTKSTGTGRSLLESVQRCGMEGGCTWKKVFSWREGERPGYDSVKSAIDKLPSGIHVFDADGNGTDDVLYKLAHPSGDPTDASTYALLLHQRDGTSALFDLNLHDIALAASRPLDPDGDGHVGLWAQQTKNACEERMLRWNAASMQMEPVNSPGALLCLNSAMGPPRVDFVDLDGDGRLDMIRQETNSPGNPGTWVVRMNQNGLLGPEQDTGVGVMGCPSLGTDIDGDGRGELLVGDGSCSQNKAIRINDAGLLEAVSVPNLEFERDDAPVVLGDLNGDGLSDALWIGQTAEMRWNTGNGFGEVKAMPDSALQALLLPLDASARSVQAVDLNGDGREDLLVFVRANSLRSTIAFLSHGNGSFTQLNLGIDPRAISKLGDFNGDGLTDILLADGGMLERLIQKPGEIDVIEEVNDEVDAGPVPRVHVEYSRELGDASTTCVFPQRCMRRGMMVVRSLSGIDVQGTQTYSYEDPRFDRHGRGFLGFGTVRVWMPERPVETIITYDHTTRWGTSYPYANRPRTIRQVTPILPGTRARVTETTNTYAVRALGPSFFVHPSSWTLKEWEEESVQIDWAKGHITGISGPGETPLRQRFGGAIFDDFGNATQEISETVGGDRREVTRVFDYGHVGEWLIEQMQSEDIAVGPADKPMPTPRHTEFVHDARGFVEQILIEPQHPDPDVRETITRVIDDDGLLRSETRTTPSESLPRAVHYEYADLSGERVFVSQVWNELGHANWFYTHPAYGVELGRMDANGVRSLAAYDDLGRVLWTKRDGQMRVAYSYAAWQFNGITMGLEARVGDDASGIMLDKQSVFTDLRGRAVRTGKVGFDGQWIWSERTFDALDRVIRATRPGVGQVSSDATTYSFDSLDRLVETVAPDFSKRTTTHTFFTSRTTDAEGHVSQLERDVDDRVIKSVSYAEEPGGGLRALTTQFQFGAFGQLEKTIDPEGHETVVFYDARGRRSRMIDPDTGETQFFYNGFGELRKTLDALSQKTIYFRDRLGRPFHISNNDGETWLEWDTAAHGVGQLASTISPHGVEQLFSYDGFGRQERTRWGIDGEKFEVETAYDAAGRQIALRYPEAPGRSRFEVGFKFNAAGYIEQFDDVSGGQSASLWKVDARNADGLLTQGSYGNAITFEQHFTPHTGRLESVQALAGSAALFAHEYSYDLDGKVVGRKDSASSTPRAEVFSYDALERLRSWQLQVGAPFSFSTTTSYDFDDLGNLTQVRKDGALVDDNGYGVATRPHALVRRNQESLLYDARGRLREGDGKSIEYTSFDLPRTIKTSAGVTGFWYDAGGSRIKKSGPSGTTITVAGIYERRDEGGEIKHVFYVQGPDGPVAQVIYDEASQKSETRFVVSDSLGSVGVVTDDGGKVLERPYFAPFGRRVAADGSPVVGGVGETRVGFTGHRHDDELGLIDMRGRVYSPELRRFLTPDPLVSHPLFGQAYNRYSYVLNRPLNFVDPSGYLTQVPTKTIGYDPSLCEGVANCMPAPIGMPEQPAPHVEQGGGPSIVLPGASTEGEYHEPLNGRDLGARGANGEPWRAPNGGDGGYQGPPTRAFVPHGDFVPLPLIGATMFFLGEFWYDYDVAGLAWDTGNYDQAFDHYGKALTDLVAGGIAYAVESGLVFGKLKGVVAAGAAVTTMVEGVEAESAAMQSGALGVKPAKGGTYQLKDRITGQVMKNGRSNNLARREGEHARDPATADYKFETKYKTDSYREQRGLEQTQIDAEHGPLDKIRGIDPRNPKRQEYIDAASDFLKNGNGQ